MGHTLLINATGLRVLLSSEDGDAARRANARAHEWYCRRSRSPFFTVYRPGTYEYLGLWVVRLWVCMPSLIPTRRVGLGKTLQAVQCLVPDGLTRVRPHPDDDPAVEESWW